METKLKTRKLLLVVLVLHLVQTPDSDFGFEFAKIFVMEKRLPDSPSRGVDKIAFRYIFFQTFK